MNKKLIALLSTVGISSLTESADGCYRDEETPRFHFQKIIIKTQEISYADTPDGGCTNGVCSR